MTTLLVSARDFATYRGVAFDPSDERAILALESASDAVRTYTGRTFDLLEETALLDGSGRNALLLPQIPVLEVTDVLVRDAWGDNEETLEDTDWILAGGGILHRSDPTLAWPWGYANISVTYTHGYDLDAVGGLPADLRAVVMNIADRAYVSGASSTAAGTVASEQIGTYAVTYSTSSSGTQVGITMDEVSTLEQYRLVPVA